MSGESGLAKKEIRIEAENENLQKIMECIEEDIRDLPEEQAIPIKVAIEEIFVNIASYAYPPRKGKVKIIIETTAEPERKISITFIDDGVPYDPLAREDPDLDMELMDRKVGGLGVYMVKESMDETFYEYKDGENILKIVKNF